MDSFLSVSSFKILVKFFLFFKMMSFFSSNKLRASESVVLWSVLSWIKSKGKFVSSFSFSTCAFKNFLSLSFFFFFAPFFARWLLLFARVNNVVFRLSFYA